MFKLKSTIVFTLLALSANAWADPSSFTHSSGAKVIDINTPNASGLSHNLYKDFNVSSKGTILNNSVDNITVTSVGNVSNNANLVDGAAKVILNEVISNQSSSLNGFIEVAGQKADVIIANPNGISCSGCSFINAGGTTLTTGTSVLNEDGSLAGFSVKKGTITIDSKGLSHADNYVDLMANAIKINGQIAADTVRVTGGGFDYDYRTGSTTSHGDTPGLRDLLFPSYSIDVAKLGGIKANQIQLVGNSLGFGVRNAGNILAENTLVVNSLGQLNNSGVLSNTQGMTRLMSVQDFNNSGTINAGRSLSAMSYSNVTNSGTIDAPLAQLYFMGNQLTNTGKVTANVAQIISIDEKMAMAQGKITNNGTIKGQIASLSGGEISQSANGHQSGELSLNVNGTVINNKGKMSGGTVTIGGTSLTNDGIIFANSNLSINTNTLLLDGRTNSKGMDINNNNWMQGDTITIGSKNLTNDGMITAARNLSITASQKLTNTNNGLISAGNRVTLTADKIENQTRCTAGIFRCSNGVIKANTLAINSPKLKRIQDLNGNVEAMVIELNKPAE